MSHLVQGFERKWRTKERFNGSEQGVARAHTHTHTHTHTHKHAHGNRIASTRDMCTALKNHCVQVDDTLCKGQYDKEQLVETDRARMSQFQVSPTIARHNISFFFISFYHFTTEITREVSGVRRKSGGVGKTTERCT